MSMLVEEDGQFVTTVGLAGQAIGRLIPAVATGIQAEIADSRARAGYELMRHALGVHAYTVTASKGGTRYSRPFRNHFCAGGDHVAIWDRLVAQGFATRRDGNEITGGDPVYFVTEAGRTLALAGIVFKRRWGHGRPTHGGAA